VMRRHPHAFLLAICLAALPAIAQVHRHDPLTQDESDALREVSMEPERKLVLYLKYAQARMDALEKLRAEPHPENRGPQMRDLLADLKNIVDEMDRNIDSFADQKLDFRKALKAIIEGDGEFQTKLKQMKEAAKEPAIATEAREYEFALLDAIDAVDGDLDNAKDLLPLQEKAAAEAKARAKERGKR